MNKQSRRASVYKIIFSAWREMSFVTIENQGHVNDTDTLARQQIHFDVY